MKKNIFYIFLLQFIGIQAVSAQIPLYEQFIVIKDEAAINSNETDYSPAFYEDGLVFISTKPASQKKNTIDENIDDHLMSIYLARRSEDGYLVKSEVFAPELLSKYHEGPLTFDRENTTVYFSRNDDRKQKLKKRKMQIYTAKQVAGKWGEVTSLPFNDGKTETMHPSISAEGDALYFASDREGGQGGMDIWVSFKDGEVWSDPVNLGETVNSSDDDVFPYISPDGTLYFSSRGRGGKGQLDIFYSEKGTGGWLEPVNLATPFNTPEDDFGLIIDRDNKNGYFSSNRKDGLGKDDIYSFHIVGEGGPPGIKDQLEDAEKRLADFQITDADGNPLEGAKVSYIDLDNLTLGQAIVGDEPNRPGVLRLKQGDDGKSYSLDFDQSIPAEQKAEGKLLLPGGNVIMKVEKDGYLPKYVTVTPQMLEGGLFIGMAKEGECMPLSVSVLNKNDGLTPLEGISALITDNETGEQFSIVTDAIGKANYCLKCNKTYTIVATALGSVSNFKTINTVSCDPSQGISETFLMNSTVASTLVVGTVIQLPNIYFNFNDATLRPDARKDLDAVVAFLNAYPNMNIELASHTDTRGPSSYNKELSQRRSENTLSYILKNGISQERLIAKGYGESQPRNRCANGVRCSEKEHKINRRTEVIIRGVGGVRAVEVKSSEALQKQVSLPPVVSPKSEPFRTTPEKKLVSGKENGLDGAFYVVAGSFKNAKNANRHLENLQKLGFSDTRIIKFNNLKLESVCVGAYNDKAKAISLANKLIAEHKIKTIVRGL